MFRRSLIYLSVCLSGYSVAHGQVINAGEKIFIGAGASVFVPETFKSTSGLVLNNGLLTVKGDWYNQDANGKVFDSRSTGKVMLFGDNQVIAGTGVTAFPDLELGGTGVKSLDQSAEVSGSLVLNDKEFVLKSNDLSVTNTGAGAITRTTGFINTDLGGSLIRATNAAAGYVFPFGSSASARYSPIVIEPKATSANSFAATLYNNSPTINGFDVNNKRPDIQSVFDRYFYLIDQVSGTDQVNIKFYTSASDGDVKQLVSWGSAATWEKATPSTYTDGSFGDNLTRELLFTSVQPIRNTAFTYAIAADMDIPLGFYNAFSPNGDGSNDLWEIKNIEMFPDNEVRIFNRSGDEIYKAKGYTSLKAWDGGTFNSGTYYYVVTVNVNGKARNFKGFITMLK
ncbi:MAG TPA: gliding motility-associated C-terminal domain-containing protein [Sphingobacteriaceae bacterium]